MSAQPDSPPVRLAHPQTRGWRPKPGTNSADSGRTDNTDTDSPAGGGLHPTHRIVVPAPDHQPPLSADLDDDTHSDPGPDSWRDHATDRWHGLRFVRESPGSLADQIEYAQDGAYSIRFDGWWRNANIWFARIIAVPGLTIGYLLMWAFFTRLPRTLTAVPITLLLLWLAHGVPVLGWFVPGWADFTTWIPSSPPILVSGEG